MDILGVKSGTWAQGQLKKSVNVMVALGTLMLSSTVIANSFLECSCWIRFWSGLLSVQGCYFPPLISYIGRPANVVAHITSGTLKPWVPHIWILPSDLAITGSLIWSPRRIQRDLHKRRPARELAVTCESAGSSRGSWTVITAGWNWLEWENRQLRTPV